MKIFLASKLVKLKFHILNVNFNAATLVCAPILFSLFVQS